ncbi:unnamed protein product [Paramecium pentaurelia]|uniref:Transmembrane protein n=1 Tax=Paramecium pentaurelia TaxID=43138 RepID=A0A8S1XE51_9CILI|nr:unnamed protein product [Paramecium pentaurelia]
MNDNSIIYGNNQIIKIKKNLFVFFHRKIFSILLQYGIFFFTFNQREALAMDPIKCAQQQSQISNRALVLQVDFGKKGQKIIKKMIGMKQKGVIFAIIEIKTIIRIKQLCQTFFLYYYLFSV